MHLLPLGLPDLPQLLGPRQLVHVPDLLLVQPVVLRNEPVHDPLEFLPSVRPLRDLLPHRPDLSLSLRDLGLLLLNLSTQCLILTIVSSHERPLVSQLLLQVLHYRIVSL